MRRLRCYLAGLLLVATAAQADPGRPDAELQRLAAAARSDQVVAREQALHGLSRLAHPDVAKVLRERLQAEPADKLRRLVGHLLSERYPRAYYRALRTFVREGRRQMVPQLIDHAIDEEARYLRALDLWVALELDPKASARRLATWLSDPDINRLIRAAELIGLCGEHVDGRVLFPLLRHTDHYVRIEALLALTKLLDTDCDEELARIAIDDETTHVRRHAVWALYERGGVIGLRAQLQPFLTADESRWRVRAQAGLSIARIRSSAEEGPLAFKYKGSVEHVGRFFRAAELNRPVSNDAQPIDVNRRLDRVLSVLDARAPKYAFFVRYSLKRITTSPKHPTGTYVATRVFNIKPATVREWSLDHLAKTLVHDATHAYLHVMGEKSGEHRGEAECFQEAFWAEKLVSGLPARSYHAECDKLLKKQHWVSKRNY